MSVLIITDKREPEMIEVYNWINYYGKTCHLVGYEDFIKDFVIDRKLTNDENTYVVREKDSKELISSIWFRRENNSDIIDTINLENKDIEKVFNNLVNKELLSLKKIFWNDGGDTIRFLSNYDSILIDKFEVLKIAQSVGLKIPETIVTNEKEVLATFIKRHGEVISKAAYENLSFQYYRTAYMQYVDSFSKQDLAKIPNNFFPSVFQQKIETEVSIRAFFLDGEIYSTAIINADNKLVDYRADFENRRTVPIKSPQNIEDNIKILMKKLSINIGGIDLLKQKEGFYFLEVNPNGYFGGNSQICNYHLPKKIAQFLTKNQ